MKTFKTWTNIFLLLAMSAVVLSSCKKQDPLPDDRDKFVGIYDVTDECSFDTSDYRVDVFKEGNNEYILLSGDGLWDAGIEIEAIVSGSKIVIPIQRYLISASSNISYEFSGNGNLDGSELIVSYRVLTIQDEIVLSEDSCRAVMDRRAS